MHVMSVVLTLESKTFISGCRSYDTRGKCRSHARVLQWINVDQRRFRYLPFQYMQSPEMSASLLDSTDAAPVAAARWGGLADTVRQDCFDSDNLDAKTHDLLQRLDELAACSGLNEVAQFLDSPRGFSVVERMQLPDVPLTR